MATKSRRTTSAGLLGTSAVVLVCLVASSACGQDDPTEDPRPRIIATTDGEIDDRCSMVRFLMYANEWDIEGIIYCSSKFHWVGHNWEPVGWIERDIDLYAKLYDNLRRHAPGFPTPAELKKKVYVGNIDNVGAMDKDTPGSDRIVEVLLDSRPGPVYLQAWGGTNTIARALWKIQHQHPGQIQKVSRKAIIYIILDQDTTFRKYIEPNWPGIQVLGSFRQFGCIAYRWDQNIPPPQKSLFEKPWMEANILKGHGPLCARYEAKNGAFRSEGDSPAFMHQIRVGLGSMEDPTFGGWGGRFVREKPGGNTWRGARDDGDLNKPIWRWAEAFQNDWAARADWGMTPSFQQANHNPKAVVNGTAGEGILRLRARPGSTVKLSAAGSSDPDGDALRYRWWCYQEPGSFRDDLRIDNADAREASFVVPYDEKENRFHVILTLRDDGSPNLFAYRRVIVESPAVVDETPPSAPAGLEASARSETQIDLTWQPAEDSQSGVRRYVVYRDGRPVGESKSTRFTDTGVTESTQHTYQVSAVNGSSKEGPRSKAVRAVTPADRTPPAVRSVIAAGKRIAVTFSEPVERAAAEDLGNYAIDLGVGLDAASLGSDRRTVTLTPSAMTDGAAYTLTVRNVTDRAKARNEIAAGTKAKFVYRALAPLVRVGVAHGETPVTMHGTVKRDSDGSLLFADGPPWRWVTVGTDQKPLGALEGLRSLTVLGWAQAASLSTGNGGNRFVFNLNYNRSGIDLVHHADGRLRLAVNQWPDRARNDSSPGRIVRGKWVFFAVTYDCSKAQENVRWYFGSEDAPAKLDRTTNYTRGPTGKGSGPLTVGNYNTTIHRHGQDRQFRGQLRAITIFGSRTDSGGALDLDAIRLQQDASS